MKEITIEEVVNLAPKDLLLATLDNFFLIANDKRQLIHGFRNSSLKLATENQLKSAVIEYLKNIARVEAPKSCEEFTLEKFEEIYNLKKWRCFGVLLVEIVSNRNIELCAEVYEKFFAPNAMKPAKEVAHEHDEKSIEDSVLQKIITEMNEKLTKANEKHKEEIAKLNDKNKEANAKYQRELDKKNVSIESLKKAKRDKEREVDELKEDKAELTAKKVELEERIKIKDDEIQNLKIQYDKLKEEFKSIQEEFNLFQNREKRYVVIYGYHDDVYSCTARADVIQPKNFGELLEISKTYQVSEIYYRPSSLNRMQSLNLSKTYPDIQISAKEINDLIARGYLVRNRKDA